MTNHLTREYLARLAAGVPGSARVAAAGEAGRLLSSALGDSGALSRPVFLDAAQLADLLLDLQALHGALVSLPQRLSGGDWRAYCRELQIPAALRHLAAPGPAPSAVFRARADLYHDGDRFRLLEFNFGGATAGAAAGELGHIMLGDAFLARFMTEHSLAFAEPLQQIVPGLLSLADAGRPGAEQPVVALAEWPTSMPHAEPDLRLWARALARGGLDTQICHIGQLRVHRDGVYLGRRRVDIVVRMFTVGDVLSKPELAEPLVQACRDGKVQIYTGLHDAVLDGKNTLALLSQRAARAALTPGEQRAVDRLLPPTWLLGATPAQAQGRLPDLIDYARHHRHDLVLKAAHQHRGTGVYCGWTMTDQDWSEAVTAAACSGAGVLQQRVIPATEPFPAGDGQMHHISLVWGVYLTERGFAGMNIRGLPGQNNGVINFGRHALVGPGLHQTPGNTGLHQ
ncbi:hypothetical protein [Streptomyces sp. XH2]|uniref:hypothetical protein n=1 Tax=Streptomyces sp. XH2 TaxID=3412483 RepID=UPI003C7E3A46